MHTTNAINKRQRKEGMPGTNLVFGQQAINQLLNASTGTLVKDSSFKMHGRIWSKASFSAAEAAVW